MDEGWRMGVGFGTGRRALLLGTLGLAGCATVPAAVTPPPSVPVNGVGYIVFNAPIFTRTQQLLLGQIDRLVGLGATRIKLGMNSPGGETGAAEQIVDAMARLHRDRGVEFEVYNIGVVASAASYVFLTAQRRFANPRSAFLFHAAGLVSNGAVNSQRLREEADKLDAYERVVKATLRRRTRLTDSEAQTYVRRTVLLNADDALRDGVIDAIAQYAVPPDARAVIIASTPPRAAGVPAATPIEGPVSAPAGGR